ncbi:gastrokine-1-like [Chlamydotis macqueenii]
MLFTIVIASLLGVFLAPALANTNEHHSENLYASFTGSGLSSGSEDWKTVRDFETGYIATKVFSKDTCIIAKMDNRFFYDNPFPAPFEGDETEEKRLQEL